MQGVSKMKHKFHYTRCHIATATIQVGTEYTTRANAIIHTRFKASDLYGTGIVVCKLYHNSIHNPTISVLFRSVMLPYALMLAEACMCIVLEEEVTVGPHKFNTVQMRHR